MSFASALESCETIERSKALQSVFGHLAPKKNKTYIGRIVYAVGCFGSDDPTPIFCKFDGLKSSPWFHEALCDFISELENEDGCVYELLCTLRNYEFKGERRLLLNSKDTRPFTA